MKTIELHGVLAKKFGRFFKLDVQSAKEACHAIACQIPAFKQFMANSEQLGFRFAVFNGKKRTQKTNISEQQLDNITSATHIHIVPRVIGSGGKTAGEYVRDEKAIAKYGIRRLDINAFGCTSRGQAQRAGLWALKSEQLETRTVSFKTGLQGFIPQVGEIINIADDLFAGCAISGRIVSANARTISLDRVAGKVGDTISINTGGQIHTAKITAVHGSTLTLDKAVGINQDDDIALHQLSGDGSAFELMERLCNRRIQKQLLGRVKTSELSNGSRSAQETDDETRQDRIKGYLDLMTIAVQHAIDAMLLVNSLYGKAIHAPNGLWFEYLEQNKVDKARAERDKLYCDTGQIKLTREYMIDMAGFEEHHFIMIDGQDGKQDSTENTDKNVPLSLQLSDTHTDSEHDDQHHHDEPLSNKQRQISQRKVDALLSVLTACDDYTEFERRLNNLVLPDGGMSDELAKANIQAYMDGISGKKNKAGEMGI